MKKSALLLLYSSAAFRRFTHRAFITDMKNMIKGLKLNLRRRHFI